MLFCNQDVSKFITAMSFKLGQLIQDNKYITWCELKKIILLFAHLSRRLMGELIVYEDCSNMYASSFIIFFTYMLRQNEKSFYKGLYVTFKLVPELMKNTVYLSSYCPLNEGPVSILTNSMFRTYTSDIDERIILR